jgi:hypothetical protein
MLRGRVREEVRPRTPHGSLWILLALLLVGASLPAWGDDVGAPRQIAEFLVSALEARRGSFGAPRLQGRYQELRDLARRGSFGVPLSVRSEVSDDQVTAEVDGIIEHPFQEVREALSTPAIWCEFAPLHANVKACTFQKQSSETVLTLYVGRRYYQSPADASAQAYGFAVTTMEPAYVSVALNASQGIFGTTAHQFRLEAAGVDGRTVIALRSSFVPSVLTRVMTAIYLATVGRNKIGFSVEEAGPGASPQYVRGFRGLVERNAMRYYLAFEAFLDLRTLPAAQRFEAGINAAYDSMERYPRQLHEMEKAEYLEAKRRERENQQRLQQSLEAASLRTSGG